MSWGSKPKLLGVGTLHEGVCEGCIAGCDALVGGFVGGLPDVCYGVIVMVS